MRYAVNVISEYSNRIYGTVSSEDGCKFFFRFNIENDFFEVGEKSYVMYPVGNWKEAGNTPEMLFKWMIDYFESFCVFSRGEKKEGRESMGD